MTSASSNRDAEGAKPPPSSPPSGAGTGRGALQCYLVEDSPIIRQNLISTIEEMLNIRVVGSAETQADAVAWLRSPAQACDLLIIDVFLKSGTGLEVLKEAVVARPGARKVVLTNYATPDMRRRCLALGADCVFDKSSQLEELLSYCEALTREGHAG